MQGKGWFRSDIIDAAFITFTSLVIIALFVESVTYYVTGSLEMPESRFAFVYDPTDELADTIRNTGVFTAVFEIDESDAADVCSHLAPSHVGKDFCMHTAWVLVTKKTNGVAIFFISDSNSVTSELVELMRQQDFYNGFIALYNGTRNIGYAQGYSLKRFLLFMAWRPAGVGTAVENIVLSREADMYEATGVPYTRVINEANSFRNNIINPLKTVSLHLAIASGVLMLTKSIKTNIAAKDDNKTRNASS